MFSAIVLICLLAFGLYSARQRAQLSGVLVRVVAALLIATAVLAAVFYLVPSLRLWRGVEALAVIMTGCGVIISRLVFARVVDQEIFKRRVLVYGAGVAASSVAALRRSSDRRGFHLVGFVQPENEQPSVPRERVLDPAGDLRGLCEKLNVTEVVVAMDDRRRGFPIRELLECRLAGVDVTELLSFLERETGRVRVDVLNPSWMIFGQGFRRDPVRLFSSRMLDLAGKPRGAAGLAALHAADRDRHQARGRPDRTDALQPAPRGPGRAGLPRAQVPQHAHRCRAQRRRNGRSAPTRASPASAA